MEGPRLTILVILLIFIFFSPDPSTVRYLGNDEIERERVEKAQDFDALANTTYGQLNNAGLNLTGFRDGDGLALHLFPVAQAASRAQEVEAWNGFDGQTPVYHDIDSQIKGEFTRVQDLKLDANRQLNLTELDPSTTYLSNTFDRNVTDDKGQLTINLRGLDEYSKWTVREVRADLSIFSEASPGNGWDAKLKGLHFPHGSIVLTTASRKFNALPALPHFMLTETDFQKARSAMNHSLTEVWKHINQGQLEENPVLAQPSCELVIWLHQRPMQGTGLYVDQIEQELLFPDGAPLGTVPPLSYVATIMSPDCGFMLRTDALVGPKAAAYTELVRRLTAAFCMVMAGQIFLLKRQMQKCATPSTRSRVSYHTFGIAAFGDGLIMMGMIAILVVDLSVFLLTGAAAFLCCIHVAFLEVKFIFDIWTIQVGDPMMAQQERERRTTATTGPPVSSAPENAPSADTPEDASSNTTAAVPSATPAITTTPAPPTSEEGLPLPATARSSAISPPIVLTPNQNGDLVPTSPRASFASLYSRFYFALVNLMFFSLWATSWSATPKHIYFNILAFCWFSLWVPQIHRNIVRNCRKALTWEYVVGTTILRAVPILYWYVDDRNVLSITTNRTTAMFLVGWLWLQIAVLVSQQYLGPRLFVPDSWCPPAYDYHPVLYDDLEAGGLPIGEVTSASEGKDKDTSLEKDKPGSRKIFDCAICMNEIDVPVLSKDETQAGSGRSWLEQKDYMVTPCRHIFHNECLEGWMNLRLACPVCRESLPPL